MRLLRWIGRRLREWNERPLDPDNCGCDWATAWYMCDYHAASPAPVAPDAARAAAPTATEDGRG